MYLLGSVAGHRLADRTVEEFIWGDGNEVVREVVYDFFYADDWVKGIGVVGDVGVGKTHLLIALYKNRMWRSVYQGKPVPVWLSFQELLSEVREDKNFVRELVSEFGIIFLDDIWSAGMGWEEKNVLRELVLYCYDKGKVLCYTSNFSVVEWDVDERVKDRVEEMCVEVRLKGSSFRKLIGVIK